MSKATEVRKEICAKARGVYQSQSSSRSAQVLSAWDSGYPEVSVSALSFRFGISERTVYRYLKSAGRSLPPQHRRSTDIEKVKRAHCLYSELGNKTEVARRMRCSAKQVSRYLKMSVEKVDG